MKALRHITFWAVFMLLALNSHGQDIHFSQHFFAPQTVNPAYTGLFQGNHRFTGNFKNQWPGVKVPYNTLALAWDGKLIPTSKKRPDFISIGAQLYRDVAGDSKFQTLEAKASIAYQMYLGKGHRISVGLSAGIVNRGFRSDGLSFDNQWNGDVFDPTLPVNETFDRTRFSFFDLGAGLAYSYNPTKGREIIFGFGILHLNQANQSFFTNRDTRLNRNYLLQLRADWAFEGAWSILPSVFFQQQDSKREVVFGMNVGYKLRQYTGPDLRLLGGFHYRWDDALIGLIGVESTSFRAAISYDMNISGLATASNLRGGVELSAAYFIRKVPKFNYRGPSCPVF